MEKFAEAVRLLGNKTGVSTTGKVKSIEGTLCVVEREGLPDLEDVRLSAIEGNFDTEFVIYPKIGSEVLCITITGEAAETAIIKYTEIDKVEIKVAGAVFKMSDGKFEIYNNSVNLKKWNDNLIDNISDAIIYTPSGPGKMSDATKLLLKQRKIENAQLLK